MQIEPTTLDLKYDALPTELTGLYERFTISLPLYIHVLPIQMYELVLDR